MARTDAGRHAVLAEYIEDLIQTQRGAGPAARRAFVRRHADKLGGYASYLLHQHDVMLGDSFQDAMRALDGEWPLSFTGYRLAFPTRLTAGMDDSLDEARAQWNRARMGTPRTETEAGNEAGTVLPLPPRGRRISA